MLKDWLSKEKNVNFVFSEVGMYLSSNYGEQVNNLYELVEIPKKYFDNNYRILTKSEAIKLKNYVFKAFIDAIKFGLQYDEIEFTDYKLKNELKEFYSFLNNRFINELNGELENINILKQAFKNYL